MLWQSLGMELWFVVVVGLVGGIGRGAKAAWPSMPASALQALVLASSYLLVFVDLALEDSAPLGADARVALWGVLLAGGAIGGHELAKKLIEQGLGLFLAPARATEIAEAILGKLGKQASPPATKRTVKATLLVVALGTVLQGCTPAQRAAVANVLEGVSEGSGWLASAIDLGKAASDVYFARHPNPATEAEVQALELDAREAQLALDALVAAADAASKGDVNKARDKALEAYGSFRALLERVGVLSARAPEGGAESEDAPEPRPVALPTVEELSGRL